MPTSSAVAKKGSANKPSLTPSKESASDLAPVRISGRVRKEKFSVKELFSHKEASSDDSPRKGAKKKTVSPNEAPSTSKEPDSTKTQSKEPVVPKPATVSKKAADIKKPTVATPSKVADKPTPKSKPKNSDKVEIFTENNIDTVLENPSSLGLDVVVTRLSDSDKDNDVVDSKSKAKTVVTISKVRSSSPPSKSAKLVPTKTEESSEKSVTKDKNSVPETVKSKSVEKEEVEEGTKSSLKVGPVIHTYSERKKLSQKLKPKPENMKNGKQKVLEEESIEATEISEKLVEKEDRESDRDEPKPKRVKRARTLEAGTQANGVNGFDSSDDDGRDTFSRYFTTQESLVEHNDSLSEESSSEGEEVATGPRPPEPTIYELMAELSVELPAWNLHVLQESGTFLVCHAARRQAVPTIDKMIELQQDFSATVYINNKPHRQFSGVYNTYDSLRQLILTVNNMLP